MTQLEEQTQQGLEAPAGGPGRRLSWVVLWTVIGAIVPGSGLIAAGWRRAGLFVLALLGVGAVALGVLAMSGNPLDRALTLAVSPQQLLILTVVIITAAVAWVIVIVLTNAALRRRAGLGSTSIRGAFSWLIVVVLVVGIGVPAYQLSHDALIQRDLISSVFKDSTADPEPAVNEPDPTKADPWASKPRINVLLIGSDAGPDRTGVRPDTMILASINTKTGDTLLFSLPRNLENAPFAPGTPGAQAWPHGYDCGDQCLLNAIWTWASGGPGLEYYKRYKNPGLQATRDAIQGVTGLKVDTYVMLNLRGFRQFVDAIGGLTVDVHERLPIGGDVEHPVATGYIEKGNNQHLDGYHALWFARSRWASSDYDRMQRQRCVIGDVVNQADPVKLARAFPQIAKAAKHNLSTGIPRRDLSAWLQLSLRVKGASVKSLPFTTAVIQPGNPDFDKIHLLVSRAIKASDRSATKATKATTPTATPTVSPSVIAFGSPHKRAAAKKHAGQPAVTDQSRPQDVTEVC